MRIGIKRYVIINSIIATYMYCSGEFGNMNFAIIQMQGNCISIGESEYKPYRDNILLFIILLVSITIKLPDVAVI